MTTTIQIRTEVETAEKFRVLWERFKEVDKNYTQGELLDSALCLLKDHLDGKILRVTQ